MRISLPVVRREEYAYRVTTTYLYDTGSYPIRSDKFLTRLRPGTAVVFDRDLRAAHRAKHGGLLAAKAVGCVSLFPVLGVVAAIVYVVTEAVRATGEVLQDIPDVHSRITRTLSRHANQMVNPQ